ncbi:MAG TPA: DNA-processing protein DprA [Methylomirabilota bacterium]|nr:DNA-processing protein DprA [Methylomirabilota bacterium]
MSLPRRDLTPSERLDWLRLIRSENVGPVTFRHLLRRFGSAGAALAALPDLARRGGRAQPLKVHPRAAAERELAELERLSGRLIGFTEPDFPAPLAAVDDSPPLLAMLGQPQVLTRPTVAIVGARNASANGRLIAGTLAREIGAAGYSIASGLARGIDSAAHEAALDTGTVAVVAGGIDVIYPPENEALYRSIATRGAVVAEMPIGTVPQARHFPRRNRLISGLSLGVVVVEAALRSGSLITARFALEQGREVFAVPGSPLDPRSAGANGLIREGALLVESAADVIAALSAQKPPLSTREELKFTPAPAADPAEREVAAARPVLLELLSPEPVAVDELLRACPFSPAAVQTALLELELAGRLARHPGNRVSLLAEGMPALA